MVAKKAALDSHNNALITASMTGILDTRILGRTFLIISISAGTVEPAFAPPDADSRTTCGSSDFHGKGSAH